MSEVGASIISKMRSDEGDRLSNLPEHIIHHIFSYLETIDVIRARAVSRKWRDLWISLPYFNFDMRTFRSNRNRTLSLSTSTIKQNFDNFVNWVLRFHNDSVDTERFRLCYANFANDSELYGWITVMAGRNVRELDLNILSVVPLELPHVLITSKSLVRFKLNFVEFCALKLPTFVAFRRLKSIYLRRVALLDDILFGNFISGSPLLENLEMEACIFCNFKILDISATRLMNLTIDSRGFMGDIGDNLRDCEIKVACSRLVSFQYMGPLAQDFSFHDLNSLQNVNFSLIPHSWQKMTEDRPCFKLIHRVLEALRNTEILHLCLEKEEYLYVIARPKRFTTSFHNLKSLTLSLDMLDIDVNMLPVPVINLLDCAPNLEALTIHGYWFLNNYDDCFWEIPDQVVLCLTYHLETVELVDLRDVLGVELLKFLLRNGRVLQKMIVRFCESLVLPRGYLIQEIMECPRASSDVVLTFQ